MGFNSAFKWLILILILSSHHVWDCQVVSFLQGSPPKPCIRLSSPPYALHAPPISLCVLNNVNTRMVTRRIRYSVSHMAMLLCSALQSVTCCPHSAGSHVTWGITWRDHSPDRASHASQRSTCHAVSAACCENDTLWLGKALRWV